ncbi:tRNA (guanine(9)-N(1))-methyltransferase [Sporothrix epigloea]|uniref:tRNA (guanine(9)-N1)-methyltransferase n=1 Tax=Sporothrix epigloea TaxID=1892477 RepID=A0ABP0D791_9PEZI
MASSNYDDMDTGRESQAPTVSWMAAADGVSDTTLQPMLDGNDAQSHDPASTDTATRPDSLGNGKDGAEPVGLMLATKAAGSEENTCDTPGTPLSKNAQKKLKRQQKWEEMRDDRKRRRKEKRIIKQEKKRTSKPDVAEGSELAVVSGPKEHTLVPVSLIFDCDFESYMREPELISLASQITRSYAANRVATRCAHIYVSSWGGKLLTRYETLLSNQHKRWSHVSFLADDFVAAAKQADIDMRAEDGGTVVDVLKGNTGTEAATNPKGGLGAAERSETGAKVGGPNLVYLTSDSPHTLSRLEPYTSYVIGGIVDKNREKGLCYGRAQARGIRTAKLPIGDYMVMASRQVLTTNHVVEIMLKWLETGDWAVAFDSVIPKRKGGHLKEQGPKVGVKETEGDGEENELGFRSEEDEETPEESDGSAVNHLDANEAAQTEAATVA